MTLLTSVIGMSYNGVTEVLGGDEGGGREWPSAGGERERERKKKRNRKRSIPVDPLPTKRIHYSCRSIASYPSLYISVFFSNVAC